MKKIIIFDSVHYTIKADKLLTDNNFDFNIIITPREISPDCGMCIEIEANELEKFEVFFTDNELNFKVFDLPT